MAHTSVRVKLSVGSLLIIALAIPPATYFAQPEVTARKLVPEIDTAGTSFRPSQLPLAKERLGPEVDHPRITNVQIVDFDRDGIPDVLACDALQNKVFWYRQAPRGKWEERVLGEELVAPAHATPVDLDADGDLDVLVSVLGNIFPDDGYVGRVVWLEQDADRFIPHVLLDDVRRVADVQAGDLDGDGDLDLAVAVFGYARGQILWLENRGRGQFLDHELLYASGAIHVPLADFDGDGDLDIATVISQDDEEIRGFENLGGGRFKSRLLHFTPNFDVGSAGLVETDLDQDGDPDLLWPLGDNLEYAYTYPQQYHGCIWLENVGKWKFVPHRIARFGGTYAAAAGDLDADGDQDVVLVSLLNDWHKPGHASVVWLENDGRQNFSTWQIASTPTHLATVACGDLDNDGRDDIVAGGLQITRPYTNPGRITKWTSRQGVAR